MSDAYVIETRPHAAAIAVRDLHGFRFFAAEPLFFALDRQIFPHLRAVRSAVDAVAKRVEAQPAAIPQHKP